MESKVIEVTSICTERLKKATWIACTYMLANWVYHDPAAVQQPFIHNNLIVSPIFQNIRNIGQHVVYSADKLQKNFFILFVGVIRCWDLSCNFIVLQKQQKYVLIWW